MILNMEKQFVQYRKLRDTKRAKTGKFSLSLLKKAHTKSHSQTNNISDDAHLLLTRNVIQYEHLLKNPLLHLHDLDWVSKLREHSKQTRGEDQDEEWTVPAVFGKSTQARKNYLSQQNKEKSRQIFNTAQYFQSAKLGCSDQSLTQNLLIFITDLRKYPQKNKNTQQKKRFQTIPFRDRQDPPALFKKESITKCKNLDKRDMNIALDGNQNYPPYTQKICNEKNWNFYPTKEKLSCLPTLAWQMSLRT